MQKVKIRPMTEADVVQAVIIEREIFSRPWTEENFRDSLRLENTIYIVAEVEETGEIAGYCGCYQALDEGNITNVAVKMPMRRKGIASALLEEMLHIGLESGIERLVLEVRVSNKNAIALYEKYGFENAGLRRRFYADPVEDAMIMLRRLA